VLTLVMACVFAAGWVRSCWKEDFVWYPTDKYGYSLDSLHGVILLLKGTPVASGMSASWGSENAPDIQFADDGKPLPFNPWEKLDIIWQSNWFAFGVGAGNVKDTNTKIEMCVINYWSIVIPLTLLSAYLLLSKPHKPTQKKLNEAVPVEVT